MEALQALCYPSFCFHCRTKVLPREGVLCRQCWNEMELISPHERCPLCFSADFVPHNFLCEECAARPTPLNRVAAVFDYIGPAATLIKRLKYGQQPYLAKGMGAWMAAQFLRLEWPLPDYIVPVPIPSLRRIERGYNQSQLLAQEISSILQIPIVEILHRTNLSFNQAGLNRRQRTECLYGGFRTKEGANIADKEILLIDDTMTTGATLRKCAAVLATQGPTAIHALAFCRAME